MAQKQFITYQSDILSFEAREAMLGVLNAGRYSGYTVGAANGAPAGGNIPILLSHTGGTQKLAKGGNALDAAIGVVVTTQGVIIHEDQDVGVTVTDNNAGGDIKYSLVYCEHEYLDGVAGPNPATYGVINGVAGAGVPALALNYKRSIVGVVKMDAGAVDFTGCTWIPYPSESVLGDTQLLGKLFGSEAIVDSLLMGTFPAEGIIGNRSYSEQNFITSEESISQSLNDLDMQLKLTDDIAQDLDGRALDSLDWGVLSDNTNHDVSISAHGFMPKLPNDANQFFNGVGVWTSMPASLLAANNLSDLADAATARNNLGVMSAADIQNNYFDDSGWKDLIRGVAASATEYRLRIRRYGRMCTIQGTFRDGSDCSVNAQIASIPYTTIQTALGVKYGTSEKVDFFAGSQVANVENNRGIYGYVKAHQAGDTSMSLHCSETYVGENGSVIMSFTITFPVDIIE